MIRPPALRLNDRVVILSPAGRIDSSVVHNALKVFEGWGLRPEVSEHALDGVGRFSGSVSERISDLQHAFDDPQLKMIFCSRGGYGTIHLLENLDFSGIKRNPKWVVGYSDITLLHAALQSKGIASIHGPMAQHFSDEGADDISVRYTKSVLAGQPVEYRVPINDNQFINRKGQAKGRLFGGNLSVFCSLLGSKYVRIPRGGILFIEDIGECPYRVDRMIHQLKLAGVFDRIGGLIVGRFSSYEEDGQMYWPLMESIRHAVDKYNFPCCFNFPVGHVRLNFPLIMGATSVLKIDKDHIMFRQ